MTGQRPSKIVCVGRNYLEHARELGNEVPAEPLIFLKPPSSLIDGGESILLPPQSAQVEFEGEIGVVVGQRLRHASEATAIQAIAGIVAINDVTAAISSARMGSGPVRKGSTHSARLESPALAG
jgi:2-keto-4-pentenoate hydratase/2-oxohepta-3-ene-1,7-dioic acid hydratase in catechol pathway